MSHHKKGEEVIRKNSPDKIMKRLLVETVQPNKLKRLLIGTVPQKIVKKLRVGTVPPKKE